MEFTLLPFGENGSNGNLKCSVASTPSHLKLQYVLTVDMTMIKVPHRNPFPTKRDGLYHHTCFEVFFAGKGKEYIEFNFSPSGDWAVFFFDRYREPSHQTSSITAKPKMDLHQKADSLALSAEIPLHLVEVFLGKPLLSIGISAVVEPTNLPLEYWALSHPKDKPDFHDRNSFALLS